MRYLNLARLLICTTLGACDDTSGDPAPDMAQDAGEPDTEVEVADVAPGCIEAAAGVPSAAFAIDEAATGTQIHAAVAFDERGVWVAYNLPEPSGDFAVWLARVDCSGALDVGPVRVHEPTASSYVDPTLARAHGRILVAWHADDHVSAANLSIRFRIFDETGFALGAEQLLDTRSPGDDAVGNAFLPAVAASPSGFVVAGAHAIEAAPAFQVFAQALTADGEPGEVVDLSLAVGASQLYPSVAVLESGDALLAWTEEEDDVQRVMAARLVATGVESATPVVTGETGAGASYAASTNTAYVAYGREDGRIVLAEGTALDGDPPRVELGSPGHLDHTPAVALGAAGGAVAWYRNVRGFANELWIQGFGTDGTASGDEMRVDESAQVAPYAPALTHVGDGTYLLVWSEGQSPDFRLLGRFVAP